MQNCWKNNSFREVTYFIQHCSGDAKKLIKDCVFLPTDTANGVAPEKLDKAFDRNHLIAQLYNDNITTGRAVEVNDVNAVMTHADDSHFSHNFTPQKIKT